MAKFEITKTTLVLKNGQRLIVDSGIATKVCADRKEIELHRASVKNVFKHLLGDKIDDVLFNYDENEDN